MSEIISIIENETDGKSYRAHRYCYDYEIKGTVEYDDKKLEWKSYGETSKHTKAINLHEKAKRISKFGSIFKYFLDGSRHTYKVDDISYNDNIYPIIAGQIGVGCCVRENKILYKEKFSKKLALALPNIAFRDGWDSDTKTNELLEKINGLKILNKYKIQFDKIKLYDRSQDEKLENKGIIKIQDIMIEAEKEMVAELVSEKKIKSQ